MLRYIIGIAQFGIVHGKDNFMLNGSLDVDWASDVDERKSTTGYAFDLW